MSLNAIYELVLHLQKFKNVELRDQGSYMMSANISALVEDQVRAP